MNRVRALAMLAGAIGVGTVVAAGAGIMLRVFILAAGL